jgi:hypothetical protein
MHARRVPIPEPCQVEWHELTPLAKAGRYCANCRHAVIDLSALTEAQAERVLRARKPNTCVSYLRDAQGHISFRASSARDVNPVTAALGALLSLAACSQTSADPEPALVAVAQPLMPVESAANAGTAPTIPEAERAVASSTAANSGCATGATVPTARPGWPGAQHEAEPSRDTATGVTPPAPGSKQRKPPHPTPKLPDRERWRVAGLMMLDE